jgi:hypothetical protein
MDKEAAGSSEACTQMALCGCRLRGLGDCGTRAPVEPHGRSPAAEPNAVLGP